MVVGSMLAILNNVPIAKHTATSTLSFVLVMGCFAGKRVLGTRTGVGWRMSQAPPFTSSSTWNHHIPCINCIFAAVHLSSLHLLFFYSRDWWAIVLPHAPVRSGLDCIAND